MKNNKLRLLHMPVLRALCAAIFVFASTNSALAQDWRFEPIFKVGGEYDDNSRLDPRTDQELDLSGLLLDARADIYYSSPATRFFLQPTVRSRNYNDDTIADSNDFFLRSDFRRRMKLSTVGFRAKFDQQTVRTGERADSDLEIEDPDEIENDNAATLEVPDTGGIVDDTIMVVEKENIKEENTDKKGFFSGLFRRKK